MRAVDTNVLIRLIARDDLKQTRAAELFIERGAWISHVVLVETIWVLDSVYGRTARQLADAVEMLLAHQHLTVEAPDVVTAALVNYRSRPSLGFSDCMIVEIARKAGHTPAGTFDRRLAKLPGTQKL